MSFFLFYLLLCFPIKISFFLSYSDHLLCFSSSVYFFTGFFLLHLFLHALFFPSMSPANFPAFPFLSFPLCIFHSSFPYFLSFPASFQLCTSLYFPLLSSLFPFLPRALFLSPLLLQFVSRVSSASPPLFHSFTFFYVTFYPLLHALLSSSSSSLDPHIRAQWVAACCLMQQTCTERSEAALNALVMSFCAAASLFNISGVIAPWWHLELRRCNTAQTRPEDTNDSSSSTRRSHILCFSRGCQRFFTSGHLRLRREETRYLLRWFHFDKAPHTGSAAGVRNSILNTHDLVFRSTQCKYTRN